MMHLPRPGPPTRQRTPSTIPLFEQQHEEGISSSSAAASLASANLRTPSEDMVGRPPPPRHPTNDDANSNNARGSNDDDVARHDDADDLVSVAESAASSATRSSANGIFLTERGEHYAATSASGSRRRPRPRQQQLQLSQTPSSQTVIAKYRRLVVGLSTCVLLLCMALIATTAAAIKSSRNNSAILLPNDAASSSRIVSASCASSAREDGGGDNGSKGDDAYYYATTLIEVPVDKPYNTHVAVNNGRMVIVVRNNVIDTAAAAAAASNTANTNTDVHVIFYSLMRTKDTNTYNNKRGGEEGSMANTWIKGNHFVLDYGTTFTDDRRRRLLRRRRRNLVSDDGGGDNNNNIVTTDNSAFAKISVSLSDTTAMIGLPYSQQNTDDSVVVTNPGEVYIFTRKDNTEIWEKNINQLVPENPYVDIAINDNGGSGGGGGIYNSYLNETVRYFYFGSSIDIVDDIACVVSDYSPNGWGEPKVYVYQRSIDNDDGISWKQIRRLELNYPPSAKECFVGDIDTLAVQVDDYTVELFKYDDYDGKYKLLQTKIKNDWMESVSFDNEYLIYSTKKEYDIYDCYETRGFTIYRRQEHHQPYILQQTINVSESSRCAPEFHSGRGRSLFHIERTGYESSIYHDDDMLVVRGDDRSIVYLKNDVGYWDEKIILNQSYRGYRLSGRDLITTAYNPVTEEDEVYYFNLENCVSVPTQMPSISHYPTSSTSPSSAPTIVNTYGNTPSVFGVYRTAYPTGSNLRCEDSQLMPSSPFSQQSYVPPESCDYSLDIVIAFDDNPSSMSWDVQLVDDIGGSDNVVVKVYKGVPDDAYQLRNESLCVDEGVYVFNIYGKGGIKYPGYYDVRVLGELVTRGDEFDCSATVTFAIPFTGVAVPPAVATMPSMTLEPSLNLVTSTLYPSALTVSTELPTSSTCTVVDISVTFDDFPEEISWAVQKIEIGNENQGVMKVFNGTVEDVQVHDESVCLSDGSYQFTIYDSAGDGLYDPGTYKVTTNGSVIAGGNNDLFENSFEKSTMFSIPFTPN